MIYKSQTVIDHHIEMSEIVDSIVEESRTYGNINDFTAEYPKYNFFGLTSAHPFFYDLFCEIRSICRNHIDAADRLWMQSWLNYHQPDQVLKWHTHHWPVHGYVSIRPHNTRTVFEDDEIVNEVGNIYIGKGEHYHRVEVDEHFDTPRITIGFDILTERLMNLNTNLGLIPFPL
jgi:hypothetical protein